MGSSRPLTPPHPPREAGAGCTPLPLSETGSAQKRGTVKGAKRAKPLPLTVQALCYSASAKPGKSGTTGRQQGCGQAVFPVRQITSPHPPSRETSGELLGFGGFGMTEVEFFAAALRNQQMIQEILSLLAGLVTAMIVAVTWRP